MNKIAQKLISKKKECVVCGGCVAVCPNNAIKFIDNITKEEIPITNYGRPRLNEQPIMVWDIDKCNQCGNCIKGCPGEALSFEK